MEKNIENKTCRHCQNIFDITDLDLEFYDKISPVFNSIKYPIPSPTLCPECRQIRRMSFRNERSIYKRKCDKTWKDTISIYNPDSEYSVYEIGEWYSDKWSPLGYWMDFDFSKSFFEQFNSLMKIVPRMSLSVLENENSPFVNQTWHVKNSYLAFNCWFWENIFYSGISYNSNNIIDCYSVNWLENCFFCVDCQKSFLLFNSQNCSNCSDSKFLLNCVNCKNCFGCINLYNKEFYIFNKQYSKEQYFEKIKTLNKDTIEKSLQELFLKNPYKNLYLTNCENVIWDYIVDSKNCNHCFDVFSSSDSKYLFNIDSSVNNSMDINYGADWELMYDATSIAGYNLLFCHLVLGSNIFYSNLCINTSNLFWCVGLHNNESYCILNKQYTKE
ncbi:MAG: hypothetical protein ACD_4C00223G0004, partial [uncultured bacterium (gcode 4)]